MLYPKILHDDFFDDFLDFPRRKPEMFRSFGMIKADICEKDGNYELELDLPGYSKDEISLSLNDGYLVIGAEKSSDKEEKDDKGRIIRKERYSGSMKRSFFVGNALTEEDVKAKFENGVLKLTFPKEKEPELPEKKTILIEG